MHMDAFNSDVFDMQTLTLALLDQPHVPRRLAEMSLFEEEGVATTSISVEKQGNTLTLVQTTQRGAPALQNVPDARELTSIPTVRLAIEDSVMADEVQNLRAFGSETDVTTLEAEVAKRNLRMSNSIEATIEYHRVTALEGNVLDADGSTLLDLFTTFGVTQQTEVDFDLDNASPASGALRKVCSSVIRLIEDELGGLPYSSIHAMVSSQFFDDLTAHPEYRANKLSWEAAGALDERIARRAVTFGGITFEEYRGTIGSTKYVADDKARIFPIGVPGLFVTRYGPAEYWDTVNTIGLPRYARQVAAREPDVYRTFRVQSHPVNICTRPRVLIPAKRT
jgi:hypothetical protein